MYDKRNACVFCGKLVQQKIKRHLVTLHKTEPRVIALLKKDEESQRKDLYGLMCEGNYKHNVEVLKGNKAELIVLKRPAKDTDVKAFGPCYACKGFVLLSDLWRHVRRCPLLGMDAANIRNDVLIGMSRRALKDQANEQTERDEPFGDITEHMRNDSVKAVVEEDPLIRNVGCYMLKNKGKTGSLVDGIKTRLRSLAKLLQNVRSQTNDERLSLQEMLQPRYFDAVIASVHSVCKWELGDANHPPSFKVPSLALKLGHGLKKAAEIAIGRVTRSGDTDSKRRLTEYLELHEREWGDRVSHAALSTIDVRKLNERAALPVTEDLVTLSSTMKEHIMQTVEELEDREKRLDSVREKRMLFNKLVELTSASITIFNKKRGGEAARLLVSTYTGRQRDVVANGDLLKTLSPLEAKLVEKLALVEVLGKRKRRVPIILTPYMQNALDTIVRFRTEMDLEDNPYLFSKAGTKTFVPGWVAIKTACKLCQLKRPDLITSTRLRKYLATVTQVLQLDDNQLEWDANHPGHNLQVHRQFYRLPTSQGQPTSAGVGTRANAQVPGNEPG